MTICVIKLLHIYEVSLKGGFRFESSETQIKRLEIKIHARRRVVGFCEY